MNFHPFIEQFPARRQSFIESLFVFAQRGGDWVHRPVGEATDDVKVILTRVEKECQDRLDMSWATDEMKADCQELIDCLAFPEASKYAKFVINQEAHRYELQGKLKGETKQRYINKALSQKAPTAKQIAYLEALGYRGSVAELSMAEVSSLINQYKNK